MLIFFVECRPEGERKNPKRVRGLKYVVYNCIWL